MGVSPRPTSTDSSSRRVPPRQSVALMVPAIRTTAIPRLATGGPKIHNPKNPIHMKSGFRRILPAAVGAAVLLVPICLWLTQQHAADGPPPRATPGTPRPASPSTTTSTDSSTPMLAQGAVAKHIPDRELFGSSWELSPAANSRRFPRGPATISQPSRTNAPRCSPAGSRSPRPAAI